MRAGRLHGDRDEEGAARARGTTRPDARQPAVRRRRGVLPARAARARRERHVARGRVSDRAEGGDAGDGRARPRLSSPAARQSRRDAATRQPDGRGLRPVVGSRAHRPRLREARPGSFRKLIAGPPMNETELPLKLFARGKVRDTYELGPDQLLMVATDRLSAFDHVLPHGIPDRGKVLTAHDENITFDQMKKQIGADMANQLRDASLALYKYAAEFSERRGLILADTKFEFGTVGKDLILIDEALTPDSSRYWDSVTYRPGMSPDSYDKQFVRDWLTRSGWDRESEPPRLPDDVVAQTRLRYLTAYQRLVGKQLFPPKPRNET